MIRPYLRDLINDHKPITELSNEANNSDTNQANNSNTEEWKWRMKNSASNAE